MSQFPRDVKDRAIEHPRRYELNLVAGESNVYDLTPVTGTVAEEGTFINKAYLQPIEDSLGYLDPVSDQDCSLTYTDGDLTKVIEYWSDGTTKKTETDLTYTSGDLTQVVTKRYNDSEVLQETITETLTYTDGDLTGVERTVV